MARARTLTRITVEADACDYDVTTEDSFVLIATEDPDEVHDHEIMIARELFPKIRAAMDTIDRRYRS